MATLLAFALCATALAVCAYTPTNAHGLRKATANVASAIVALTVLGTVCWLAILVGVGT